MEQAVQWFTFDTYQGAKGLHVNVKTHPKVEAFIQSLGSGSDPVKLYDKRWLQVKPDQKLDVYKMDRYIDTLQHNFVLDRPGKSLAPSDDDVVNLSFLRLVGISGENGVEFVLNDVISLSGRRELAHRVTRAFEAFAMNYIQPVRISFIVSGREY